MNHEFVVLKIELCENKKKAKNRLRIKSIQKK